MNAFSPKPSQGSSTRSVGGNLAGILIFALGLAALSGVGVLAYFKLAGLEEPVSSPPGQAAPDLRGTEKAQEPALQGIWQASFGSGRNAALLLKDGAFRLEYTPGAGSLERHYSYGVYGFDPEISVLTLQPVPAERPEKRPGVEYRVLTHRSYSLSAASDPERPGTLFLKPHVREGVHDQVHPLFFLVGRADSFTAWEKP